MQKRNPELVANLKPDFVTRNELLFSFDPVPAMARLASAVSGGTSFTLQMAPDIFRPGLYILSPYTAGAEAVLVIAISGATLTTHAAIIKSHSANAPVLYLARSVVTPQMFAAKGDGTTDDTTAVQAAFDVIATRDTGGYYRGITVYFPAGTYRVTASLDVTDRRNMLICGDGIEQSIILSEAVNKAAIDLCGSAWITFENFAVVGAQTAQPFCAFFHARTTASNGEIAAFCLFRRIVVRGYMQKGAWLGFSCELNKWEFCWVHLTAQASLEFGIYLSAYNDYSLTSDYATLSSTASNSSNWIENLNVVVVGASNFVPVVLGNQANSLTLTNSYLATTGPCKVWLKETHYQIRIEKITFEQETLDTILITTSSSSIISNLVVRDTGDTTYTRSLIRAEDGVVCERLVLENTRGGNNISALRFDELWYARIDNWYSTPGVGGIVVNKVYHSDILVPSSGITINTQSLYNILRKRGGSGAAGNTTVIDGGALSLGGNTDTTRAVISKILTATASWTPSSTADGGVATTFVTLTGSAAGNVAWASLSAGSNNGLIVSGVAGGNVVYVTVYNRTGATWNPGELTVRVAVMRFE